MSGETILTSGLSSALETREIKLGGDSNDPTSLKRQILTASVRAVKLAAEALKRPWDSLLQGNLLTRQEDFLCNAATSVKPPLIGYNPMPLALRLRWCGSK